MNHVEEILKRSIEIHLKKRADYASQPDANPFENFERSNEIATWFPPEFRSFGVLIGTKLARLGALLSSGRTPNNESIDDSFLDLVTYCALAYGYYKSKGDVEKVNYDYYCGTCGLPIQFPDENLVGTNGKWYHPRCFNLQDSEKQDWVAKCWVAEINSADSHCVYCGGSIDKQKPYTIDNYKFYHVGCFKK